MITLDKTSTQLLITNPDGSEATYTLSEVIKGGSDVTIVTGGGQRIAYEPIEVVAPGVSDLETLYDYLTPLVGEASSGAGIAYDGTLAGHPEEILYVNAAGTGATSDSQATRDPVTHATNIEMTVSAGKQGRLEIGTDIFGVGNKGISISYNRDSGNQKFYYIAGDLNGGFEGAEYGYKDFTTGVNNVVTVTDTFIQGVVNLDGGNDVGYIIGNAATGMIVVGKNTAGANNAFKVLQGDASFAGGATIFEILCNGQIQFSTGLTQMGYINPTVEVVSFGSGTLNNSVIIKLENGIAYLGDSNVVGNSTYLTVDDTTQVINIFGSLTIHDAGGFDAKIDNAATLTANRVYSLSDQGGTLAVMGDGASAPAVNAIGVLVDYFGASATRSLNTPNSWGSVTIAGTSWRIPLYTP